MNNNNIIIQDYWSDVIIGFYPKNFTGTFPSDLQSPEDFINRAVSQEEKARFFAMYGKNTWVFNQKTHTFIFTPTIHDWTKDAEACLGFTNFLVAYDVLPHLDRATTTQLLAYRAYLVRIYTRVEEVPGKEDDKKLKTIDEF